MVRKTLLSGIFIIPALLLMGFNFSCTWAKTEKNFVPVKAEVQKQNGVIVYYFYSKPECVSCKKINAYTQEVVEALNNPDVEFRTIDLDKPENKHYYKDYGLYTKSVVLSEIKDGKEFRYKNLDKIWTKVRNEEDFKTYITSEIKTIMEN